jgi:hypothetical protein
LPGLIIAHNDAASHNAAWHQGRLTLSPRFGQPVNYEIVLEGGSSSEWFAAGAHEQP